VSTAPVMKRVLAIDFGQARTGLAISDELGLLAHPLETVNSAKMKAVVQRIAILVREKNIESVVVGLPRNMDGSHGGAAEAVLAFVEKLRAQLSCPIVTWDERLTTVAANRALREAGHSTRHTRGRIDQLAAQMILQGYLDQRQMGLEKDAPEKEDVAD
jgi:putative holliday junction resolvase